ncbi:MAG: hypothetical protein JJU07_16165 [Natronohydrobacter sp.]|nr:hypothetical protein [Natronohydrobacter sp.]
MLFSGSENFENPPTNQPMAGPNCKKTQQKQKERGKAAACVVVNACGGRGRCADLGLLQGFARLLFLFCFSFSVACV